MITVAKRVIYTRFLFFKHVRGLYIRYYCGQMFGRSQKLVTPKGGGGSAKNGKKCYIVLHRIGGGGLSEKCYVTQTKFYAFKAILCDKNISLHF